jgi:uncharacterized protein (TIGR00252 family)
MNSKDIGNYGEDEACKYLEINNYKIIDRNWRTKWCEVDIVCSKNNIIYFVEVKYRRNNLYGDGLEAITSNKLKQMKFAAEMWAHSHKLKDDYTIAVVSVSPSGTDFVEIY